LAQAIAPGEAAGDIGNRLGRALRLVAVMEDDQTATAALAEMPVASKTVQ